MSAARTPLSGTPLSEAEQPGHTGLDDEASLTRTQDDNLAVQGTPEDEEEMEADLIEQEELEDATAGLDGEGIEDDEDAMDEEEEDVIPLPDQSQPGGYR